MTGQREIVVPCLEIRQPIGLFYIGVMSHQDVVKISYADIRRLGAGSEMREVEVYTGIQRELSQNRVKEIGKYVNLVDATFPTSVILHISKEHANYDKERGVLILPFSDDIAKVLDGQHRIAGLENFESHIGFDVCVTFFVEMELEDQALIFATINQTQTKVNKSLVSDLYAFAKFRSPQKTCHNVIRALNLKDGSPFKDKIKILGVADDAEKETITQATFAQTLIKFISADPMTDRNTFKMGEIPREPKSEELFRQPLREMFLAGNDHEIAQTIWNYFSAVRKRWPEAWNLVQKDFILNKSTGFVALMDFFKRIYIQSNQIGKVLPEEYYLEILMRIKLESADFHKAKYIPGGSGKANLLRDFISLSGIEGNSPARSSVP